MIGSSVRIRCAGEIVRPDRISIKGFGTTRKLYTLTIFALRLGRTIMITGFHAVSRSRPVISGRGRNRTS
jgi:hypothetical protein